MDADEALARLDEVKSAMHEQFPRNTARLDQLDFALATAAMAVGHLHDEHARAAHDRAERIRRAEQEE